MNKLSISRINLNLLIDLSYRHLTTILLLRACLFRKESRGGHFRQDIPLSIPFWKCHSRQIKGRDISTKIEETLVYPGEIKVTVIRETRTSTVAR